MMQLKQHRKVPQWMSNSHNSGDDIGGTIEKTGSAVSHLFRAGQRVAAFHKMREPHGSFAEYAVAPASTTFAIPDKTSFEEAATIPLAAMTAAVGLFSSLGLPEPWVGGATDGKREKPFGPVVIYGAASAVGAFAIQLAKRAGLGPLLCVAGKGIPFVEKMLDKSAGDAIIDYRQGDDAVVEGLKKAAQGAKLMYAYDAVSEKGSYINLGKVLDKGGKMTTVLPGRDFAGIPDYVENINTMVGCAYDSQSDFGQAWYALMGKGLIDGWFKGHPAEVVPGGLNGVQTALRDLKDGKASAVKYVFRIADTPGLHG